MKTQKIIIIVSIITGLITLLLAVIFNYGINICIRINANSFLSDIFICIFTGSIISFSTAVITYFVTKKKHINDLLISLINIHNSLSSYITLKGKYEKIVCEEILLDIRSRIIAVYDTIIQECQKVNFLILSEDFYSKELKNQIPISMNEIKDQIDFMRPALMVAREPSRIGLLIDGQKENIIRNDFTSKTKEVLLKVVKKYSKKYYRDYENLLSSKTEDSDANT